MKALDMEPNNPTVLDAFATFLLDMDNWERAKPMIEQSIKIEPDGHYAKYMNYGQLHQGKDALQYYQKGVELMIRERDRTKDKQERRILGQQIASAFVTIAEIFLTDSCTEDNAEEECGRALSTALQYDDSNPEVYQTLASYRISQQKPDEAVKFLTQSYNLWKDLEYEELPSLEFRHNTAKLFVELNQPKTATAIWESILEEDDAIAEVYYHMGLAYRQFDSQAAREQLEKALQLLQQCNDPQLLQDVQTVYQEIKNENIQSKEEKKDDGSDDDDDNDGNDMDVI